jgi:protein-tyrosine phosphatase
VPRQIVVEEYMLSDGANRDSIELAIDGILATREAFNIHVPGLRTALLSRGGPKAAA